MTSSPSPSAWTRSDAGIAAGADLTGLADGGAAMVHVDVRYVTG
ncbi:hypothetical protein [Modestobacter altitudinis]|nr:hypothetical protein [Modestobacter altitudinis]